MRITDYEKGQTLRDVCIQLTREEAEDLVTYVHHLLKEPGQRRAWVSEIAGFKLEKELTISLIGEACAVHTEMRETAAA